MVSGVAADGVGSGEGGLSGCLEVCKCMRVYMDLSVERGERERNVLSLGLKSKKEVAEAMVAKVFVYPERCLFLLQPYVAVFRVVRDLFKTEE